MIYCMSFWHCTVMMAEATDSLVMGQVCDDLCCTELGTLHYCWTASAAMIDVVWNLEDFIIVGQLMQQMIDVVWNLEDFIIVGQQVQQ